MDESFWQSFQDWEKRTSETWTSLIRSPQFIDLMNHQLETWLLIRQQFDRAVQESLQTAQLPTRAEQEQVCHLAHELESQVEELAGRIDRLYEMLTPPEK
jgi:signal transduction histidine kinase